MMAHRGPLLVLGSCVVGLLALLICDALLLLHNDLTYMLRCSMLITRYIMIRLMP